VNQLNQMLMVVLLDGRKKMVRCYLRICGVYESTEIAKAVADSQMENIYLTLYRSDPTREIGAVVSNDAVVGDSFACK
jgi:hypothetical protein